MWLKRESNKAASSVQLHLQEKVEKWEKQKFNSV